MADENELYAKWRGAGPKEREAIYKQLHAAVRAHARAVVMNKLPEARVDLPDHIADTIMVNLECFQRKSKFSTWVQGISKRIIAGEIRRVIRDRKVFDRSKVVPSIEDEEFEHARNRAYPVTHPDYDCRIAVDELFHSLSKDQRKLLRLKRRRVPSAQIAKQMRISREAVDSRWTRLKPTLRKML